MTRKQLRIARQAQTQGKAVSPVAVSPTVSDGADITFDVPSTKTEDAVLTIDETATAPLVAQVVSPTSRKALREARESAAHKTSKSPQHLGRRLNRVLEKQQLSRRERRADKIAQQRVERHERRHHLADFHPEWTPTESIPVIAKQPHKTRSHNPNPGMRRGQAMRKRTPIGHLRNGVAATLAISALALPLPSVLVAEASTGAQTQSVIIADSTPTASPQQFRADSGLLDRSDLGYENAKWERSGVKFPQSSVAALDGKTIPAATKIYRPLAPWSHITSDFGPRSSPCAGCSHAHKGIDVQANTGTPIIAIADGIVIETGANSIMGNYINVVHYIDGKLTVSHYQHLSKIDVKVGDEVKGGKQIGLSGHSGVGTGPHLHFEIEEGTATYDKTWAHSVDPDVWLAKHVKGYKKTTNAPWTYDGGDDGGND